jgi:hypothetical protein
LLRLKISGYDLRCVDRDSGTDAVSPPARRPSQRDRQQLQLCQSLARPLAMFDNRYATELNVYATRLAIQCGDVRAQTYMRIGEAVFASYSGNESTDRCRWLLDQLKSRVEAWEDAELLGDYWSAVAYFHMLRCRWNSVDRPIADAIRCYQQLMQAHSFEVANTLAISLWSNWHLGNWPELLKVSEQLQQESLHRNDLVESLYANTGFGALGYLVGNETSQLARQSERCDSILSGQSKHEYFGLQLDLSRLFRVMYLGDWQRALQESRRFERARRRSPLRRMQLLRVHSELLSSLVALQRLRQSAGSKEKRLVRQHLYRLKRERLDFTETAAELIAGLYRQLIGEKDAATKHAVQARRLAGANGCMPIELAATDLIGFIQTGEYPDQLRHLMANDRVRVPESLERLYTVRLD